MRQYYFLSPQNEQLGPVDASQLPALGVKSSTMVWAQGMPQWVPASSVEELKGIIPVAAAAAVPPVAPAVAPAPQPAPYMGAYPHQPMMPKPNNHMLLAILSTIFCCLPTGIVAIIYANQVDSTYAAGDYAGAQSKANAARNWAIVGAVGSLVISIIYLIVYAGTFAAAMGGVFDNV